MDLNAATAGGSCPPGKGNSSVAPLLALISPASIVTGHRSETKGLARTRQSPTRHLSPCAFVCVHGVACESEGDGPYVCVDGGG